jgi:VWFA-related protein
MRRTVPVGALLGLLMALSTGSGRAQQDQQAQPPIFRTGVNYVRVDAIVTDKNGALVSDLKPEDFEIIEQDKVQTIDTFRLVSLDSGVDSAASSPLREIRSDIDEEREAARDDVRLFAVFLDDYHVRRESSFVTRDQIARFIQTELRPSDMITLMYPLESITTLRMTRNHDAVAGGIRQFEGRKYDYRPRNGIEERYARYPVEIIEKIRNQVSMSAIEALIIHLGGLKEGRKALILVSEGYTGIVPPQMRDADASLPGVMNPNARNPQAGVNDLAEERAMAAATFDIDLEMRQLYTAANRYNVSIYTVDPRGLGVSEFGIDQTIGPQVDRQYLSSSLETLRTLAAQTDGRAIINRNDLAIGMKQIVTDTSAYYLIGYNSTFTDPDGKFHEIKVRVKRPGVQVRARKGYWAMNRAEAAAASAPARPSAPKPVENALNATSIAATASRSRVIRSWIGTERGENGKTKVTFVWEPIPQTAGQASRAPDPPARVSLTAASSGSLIFRGPVPDAGRRVTFEVEPGTMELRVAVEAKSTEVIDSETRDVTIPDLTAPQTSLSTPQIFRARTVRDLQQIKADPQPVPTIAREFARADRLLIKVAAYGPGLTPPALASKLLGRGGQTVTTLEVTPPSGDGGLSQIELPLSSLAPGDYVLEIDASGEGGNAQELVGFRIVG